MVRNTLGHGHPTQVPGHRCGFLPLDHDPVRTVCQTFQRGAVFLRHATKEEAVSNARPELIRDFRLIVRRPDRICGYKVRPRPIYH